MKIKQRTKITFLMQLLLAALIAVGMAGCIDDAGTDGDGTDQSSDDALGSETGDENNSDDDTSDNQNGTSMEGSAGAGEIYGQTLTFGGLWSFSVDSGSATFDMELKDIADTSLHAGPILIDGTEAWVGYSDGTIGRVDIEAAEVVANIDVLSPYASELWGGPSIDLSQLAICGDNLYAATYEYSPVVLRVDRQSETLEAWTIVEDVSGGATDIYCDGNKVWITISGGRIARLDGTSLELEAVAQIGLEPTEMLVAGNDAWVIFKSPIRLGKVALDTLEVTEMPEQDGFPGDGVIIEWYLSANDHSLYVHSFDGEHIYRFNKDTGDLLTVMDFTDRNGVKSILPRDGVLYVLTNKTWGQELIIADEASGATLKNVDLLYSTSHLLQE